MMKLPVFLTLMATTLGSAGTAATSVCALTLSPHTGTPLIFADDAPSTMPDLLLVDSDGDEGDDDDDEGRDDEGDNDCEDDDNDGTSTCNGKGNAAPAGTAKPPKNGLFGDGKAPSVKTN